MSSCAFLMALLLVACQAVDPGLPPAQLVGLPWGQQPADRLCWSARQDVERGDPERALVQLATILAEEPRHVDANRLRQDLLRERGRRGRLLIEAQHAVQQRPDDGLAHYLLARIVEDPKAKLNGFARAIALAKDSIWPWLGYAHTLRNVDRARSLLIYERLFAATDQHPLVAVGCGVSADGRSRGDVAVPAADRSPGAASIHDGGPRHQYRQIVVHP